MAVLDAATVESLCRHWDDGWNRADLATIMAPFADDVVFSSPGIALISSRFALTALPPSTGVRCITAYSIPGTFTSIPKIGLPVRMSLVSTLIVDVPIIL